MTDSNKKAKVLKESTQQTTVETYKKFIENHDRNVWSCLTETESAKTLSNYLREYRWSVFSNGLSDEFILQSVGFELATNFKGIEKFLIRELDGMFESEYGNHLLDRRFWNCDFKSVFEHVYIPCRMFIAPTFLRSLSTSIMWILISRIIVNGKNKEVLRRIVTHREGKKQENREQIGLDFLVQSELCREFFESLTNQLSSLCILRPFEVIADLPVKLIASHVSEYDYKNFALTCKKLYAILSDKKNLGFVVDVRFRRVFGGHSDEVINILNRYYENGYPITTFKCNAIRTRDPLLKHLRFDVDFATLKWHINTLFGENTQDNSFILQNGTTEQLKRLFENENSGVGEHDLIGETFEAFVSVTEDWDVVEKICIGDRGEVFQSLRKFYPLLRVVSINPGLFKMLVYCINNVYMTAPEREDLQNLLLSKLYSSHKCIWRILNDLVDCSFILDHIKYTDVQQPIMTYVLLAIYLWRSEKRPWEIADKYLHAEVSNFLVYEDCSSDSVLMLWRVKRDYEFWKKVLFRLIDYAGRKEKIRIKLLLVGFLVDASKANVKDNSIPFYGGCPRTVQDLAKCIVVEHLQNCHVCLQYQTELIRLMNKLRDSEFWSFWYLEKLKSATAMVTDELFVLLQRSGLVSEKLEYLLTRGVNGKQKDFAKNE